MPQKRKDTLIPDPYGNPSNWFGNSLTGREVVDESKTRWKMLEKISERSTDYPYGPYDEAEAQAVYHCREVGGRSYRDAIAKVRMQIPKLEFDDPERVMTNLYWLRWDRRKYASQASPDYMSRSMYTEIQTIRDLEMAGCTSTPKLFAVVSQAQTIHDWVPGGYLHFTIMEKLPGVTLGSIWDPGAITDAKKQQIWSSFKIALGDMLSKGLQNYDTRNENTLWGEATGKCYMIDLESSGPHIGGSPWDDEHYQDRTLNAWGLGDQAMEDRISRRVQEDYEKRREERRKELGTYEPGGFYHLGQKCIEMPSTFQERE